MVLLKETISSGLIPPRELKWIDEPMDFFLCVLGMVMIIEGLPYFAFPEQMKFWVSKILEMPDAWLRRFGLVLMFTGLGLVYLGKR
jgi:uncharacterized protein YjeT (DUF2065 family)